MGLHATKTIFGTELKVSKKHCLLFPVVHVTKRGKPGLRNFTTNKNLWPHISIGQSSTVKVMEIR